jgi:O-antigen biosynthesis protein
MKISLSNTRSALCAIKGYFQENGGFKKTLPKIFSVLIYAFRKGGVGHLKNMFRSFFYNNNSFHIVSSGVPLECILNELTDKINAPNIVSDNVILIKKILAKKPYQICIIDHQCGGGANKYRNSLVTDYLTQENVVVLLCWNSDEHCIDGNVLYKNIVIEFVIDDLDSLISQDVFKFKSIVLNSIAMWSVKDLYSKDCFVAVSVILRKIMELSLRHGSDIYFSFHDFYPVCPKYTLIDDTNKFCSIRNDSETCKRCLSSAFKDICSAGGASYLENWRRTWQCFFDTAKEIRFFSKSSQNIAQKVFSFQSQQIIVVPHRPLIEWDSGYRVPLGSPMIIGVIGNISIAKGAQIVKELSWLLEKDQRIIIIGNIEHPEELAPKTVVTGSYELRALPDILAKYKVTIGFVPSVCPETFSYVTQECMGLDLPLVCFDIGAPAERLRDWKHGLVATAISAESALKTLNQLDARRKEC